MITNKVKLVIWDLDETFWKGTLAEEGMTPVAGNADKVMELSRRGIVNSICSKNDYERAKSKLVEMGIWEYFVFPSISFNPKGKQVAEMIEGAALRAENVLFIDDNPSNLEEVKFFNPGIMAVHPQDALEALLDHPHLAGKPDPELTRLKQYQFLQKKVEERSTSSLSNEEFLRASNIRVTIDYDIDANFDRVVELINRTNQLNYTKKRLETSNQIARFRELVNESYGYHAGCVRAQDNYGDYGLIGFFLMKRIPRGTKLIHFVFSCRTMNMGIEQYVYEMLGRPGIEVAEPVSYGVETYAAIDWINVDKSDGTACAEEAAHKLVLLGGCDLLQLASYCSTDRLEFVNRVENGVKVCYEDVGFIMGDREVVRESAVLPRLSYWTYEDCLQFDDGIAAADLILLSMWPAMNGENFATNDGVEVRFTTKEAKNARDRDPEWFDGHLNHLPFEDEDVLERVVASFDSVRARIRLACRVFILGVYTLGDISGGREARRSGFNKVCREYCEKYPEQFCFVDFDTIVPSEYLVSGIHFSRHGYFEIARFILSSAGMSGPALNVKLNSAPAAKKSMAIAAS